MYSANSSNKLVILILNLIISKHNSIAFILFPPNTQSLHAHQKSCRRSTSSNIDGNNNKYVFSSQRERQNEEKRKSERMNDVIIGKTSAKLNEKDLPLNIKKTEEEYLQSNSDSDIEREVYIWTDRGMEYFRMLKLEEASISFENVYTLKPDAYIYHSGITNFYLNELHKAGKYLHQNVVYYENKFNDIATEERIWYIACELKLRSNKKMKELKECPMDRDTGLLIPLLSSPPLPVITEDWKERRKVLRLAYDLFKSTLDNDAYTLLLTRTKLRMMGATIGTTSASNNNNMLVSDPKLYKLQSWYYLGLHYDAIGNTIKSKHCMKNAILQTYNKSMNGGDIMKCLPLLHMSRRDWFDDEDDDYYDENHDIDNNDNNNNKNMLIVNDYQSLFYLLKNELHTDCYEFLVKDILNALKSKGDTDIKLKGNKPELVELLVKMIMNEILDDTSSITR